MEIRNYKDSLINVMIEKIRNDVSKRINLEDEFSQDICSNRIEIVEEKMRKLLSQLIGSDDNFELFHSSLYWLRLNNEVANRIHSLGMLYYTAFYFDNVKLLQKLLEHNISFGENPESLKVFVLDKDFTTLFEDDEYVEVLDSKMGFFEEFYNSLKDINPNKKRKYYEKFARILKARKDISRWQESFAFTKERLDMFEEESYLKATIYQFSEIIEEKKIGSFNVYEEIDPEDKVAAAKFNRLLQETNFSKLYRHSDMDIIFETFTSQELEILTPDECDFFSDALYEKTLPRVVELYRLSPNLISYSIICRSKFLEMYSNEEILAMSDETLELLDSNCYYFLKEYSLTELINEGEFGNNRKMKKLKRRVHKEIGESKRLLEQK